jgi:anti-sigma factor (TIGR02949 family)
MGSSKDKKLADLCSMASGDTVVNQTTSVEITHSVVGSDGEVHTVTESINTFDFYSCEEAIKRLNEYLDAELEPAEREDVLKHLQICAPCLERFHFEKSLIKTLRIKVETRMAPLKLKERLAALMKNGN